jgi:hypothetical protein
LRRALVAAALTGLAGGGAGALETDQYYAWGVPLQDSTAALNAKINYEIDRALTAAAGRGTSRPPSCRRITREFRRRVDFVILQPIEAWVTHSPLVALYPATPETQLAFRHEDIYGGYGPLDIGRWVPDSPTVEAGGVRFGTDKISHFFSSGWRYRKRYLDARDQGMNDQQAEAAAVRWGVLEERTGLGLLVDGVFSRGDLEANRAGMRFYLNLCDGPDPLLVLDQDRWQWRRRFDWREYVTPDWDESYNVSIYSRSRWRKVRPRLAAHCGGQYEPWTVEQRARYQVSVRPSPTDAVVDELVRAGRLPDPASFTLEAICPAGDVRQPPVRSVNTGPLPEPAQGPESQPPDEAALIAEIGRREADRDDRIYLSPGAAWTSYSRAATSLGWLFTSVESGFDCRTICDLRGAIVRLEPGLDSGQLALGYARAFGETGRYQRFMPKVYLAYGISGVVLRTWRDGALGPAGLDFVGLQGQFTVTSVSFRLGALWQVGGGSPRNDFALTWSVGWGF